MITPILPLKSGEVHVWRCKLSVWRRGCLSLLSIEEKEQWLRFISDDDRRRYALAHASLRIILERYTKIPADQIEFTKGLHGKPQLKTVTAPPVYFNLSYRNEYALVAVSLTNFIGVDVESTKDVDLLPSFVDDYFAAEEKQKVLEFEDELDRLDMLSTLWAMKEALVKAKSTGVAESLNQYDLSPFLNKPKSKPHFDGPNTWHIQQIAVADNYKAACAVRCEKARFKIFDCDFY
jgi:4'-phosphopantetheinyl transferase